MTTINSTIPANLDNYFNQKSAPKIISYADVLALDADNATLITLPIPAAPARRLGMRVSFTARGDATWRLLEDSTQLRSGRTTAAENDSSEPLDEYEFTPGSTVTLKADNVRGKNMCVEAYIVYREL